MSDLKYDNGRISADKDALVESSRKILSDALKPKAEAKPREWWIVEYFDGDRYFCDSKDEVGDVLSTMMGEPLVRHVIEYSAYRRLESERSKAIEAMTSAHNSLKWSKEYDSKILQKVRWLWARVSEKQEKLEFEVSASRVTVRTYEAISDTQRNAIDKLEQQLAQANTRVAELESQLDEIRMYIPKVPTEPYEKQMANRIQELEAALNRVAILGMGEKAYTKDFTTEVNGIARQALAKEK